MTSTSSTNSLGLDFDQLKITEQESNKTSEADAPPQEDQQTPVAEPQTREKKKPYVNLERVKTGGTQRVPKCRSQFICHVLIDSKDKLSEEALTERMARMREQNEKIKQRRLVNPSILPPIGRNSCRSGVSGCASGRRCVPENTGR